MAPRKNKSKHLTTFDRRTFLNPKSEGGIAAIEACVKLTESDTAIHISSSLSLSDCSNHICLDFDIWDSTAQVQALRRRRKKIAFMREIVNGFLDATEAAYDEIEKKLPAKEAALKAKRAKEKAKKKT